MELQNALCELNAFAERLSEKKKKTVPIKIDLALLPKKPKITPPPAKTRNFMGMEVSCRKHQKLPGAHKIGAAISGPRTADEKLNLEAPKGHPSKGHRERSKILVKFLFLLAKF